MRPPVYTGMLVGVGSVLFGKSFTVDTKKPSSSLHQQRGIVGIEGGEPNNKAVIQLASATRVNMSLKLDGRIFLVVEMKKPSFFRRTPQDDIPDYKHKDDTHNDGNRSHVLAQGIDQYSHTWILMESVMA